MTRVVDLRENKNALNNSHLSRLVDSHENKKASIKAPTALK